VRKLVNILILLPIAVILIALSIANRGAVTLALNPFAPDDSVLSITGPFFVFLFVTLMLGILIGGLATFTQGHYRNRARKQRYEAAKWQNEADRQRERANDLARQTGGASPNSLTSGSGSTLPART
jgi:hypothetical protein